MRCEVGAGRRDGEGSSGAEQGEDRNGRQLTGQTHRTFPVALWFFFHGFRQNLCNTQMGKRRELFRIGSNVKRERGRSGKMRVG